MLAGCASGPDSRYVFQSPDLPPSQFGSPAYASAPAPAPRGRSIPVAIDTPSADADTFVPPTELSDPLPRPALAVPPEATAPPTVIIRQAHVLSGRLVLVNVGSGLCVVNFPIGKLPATDQKMLVYRNGVKVGEILITGPQRDDNIAADILSGKLQTGDEARDR